MIDKLIRSLEKIAEKSFTVSFLDVMHDEFEHSSLKVSRKFSDVSILNSGFICSFRCLHNIVFVAFSFLLEDQMYGTLSLLFRYVYRQWTVVDNFGKWKTGT